MSTLLLCFPNQKHRTIPSNTFTFHDYGKQLRFIPVAIQRLEFITWLCWGSNPISRTRTKYIFIITATLPICFVKHITWSLPRHTWHTRSPKCDVWLVAGLTQKEKSRHKGRQTPRLKYRTQTCPPYACERSIGSELDCGTVVLKWNRFCTLPTVNHTQRKNSSQAVDIYFLWFVV